MVNHPSPIFHRTIEADGVEIFFREAGDRRAPTLLLLHGFPTSSHMYRRLVAELSDVFHVVAPDLPGFGFTFVPPERNYEYTFDSLAATLRAFVDGLKLERYILYVFDYGAPVGFRLALDAPERVVGLISQNGNAYLEGLGEGFMPIQKYWSEPNLENEDALRKILSPEVTRWQYEQGVPDRTLVAPETYTLDQALLQRSGSEEIQLSLFRDYQHNLELYPTFQEFMRKEQPPTLVIWGEHDPFFIPDGAYAFLHDNPNAQIELLDTGHFAIETHGGYIVQRIREFFLALT